MAAAPRSSHLHRPLVGALVLSIVPLAGWATVRHLDAAERSNAIARARGLAADLACPTSLRCGVPHTVRAKPRARVVLVEDRL